MSVHVTINDTELQRKLAKFAILSQKGLDEATRAVASRFTKAAVGNTPPMILRQSASQAKAEWTAKLMANYEKKRFVRGAWVSKAEMKKLLAAKKKQLGREAAGWKAAAEQLNAKIPAWVRRHSGEGSCIIRTSGARVTITVTNSVPYGDELLRIRSNYVLQTVNRGMDGTLRAMKRKLIRSV